MLPQGRHKRQVRDRCDDDGKQEQMKLDTPTRYEYQRSNKERHRNVFFYVPHKKYLSSFDYKKLSNDSVYATRVVPTLRSRRL